MSNDEQQPRTEVLSRYVETYSYTTPGTMNIGMKDWEVSGRGPSVVLLYPLEEPGLVSAGSLRIKPAEGTPNDKAVKVYRGDGEIRVAFTHPPDHSAPYEWELKFADGTLGALTVKIRKTRVKGLQG